MYPRLLLLFFVSFNKLIAADAGGSYHAEIERWRKEKEERHYSDVRLMAVGRMQLHDGRFSIGSNATNELVLPVGPAMLGTVEVHGNAVQIELKAGLSGMYNNQPTTKMNLPLTQSAVPNPLWVGAIGLSVRERNGEVRLSVFDRQADFTRARKPFRWFPVSEKYRITAKFTPFDKPTTLSLPDSDGSQREYASPGLVSFSIAGQEFTLQPIESGKGLFFVFRDTTSGKSTYGAGRFLEADAPKNGTVVLDFNQATNPLCAYNAFVVCPMPPKQNRLPVDIPAGELNFLSH